MPSSVESVASFTVVLAEAFTAVGLCTLLPAGVVTMARLAKNLPAPAIGGTPGTPATPAIPGHPTVDSVGIALAKTPAKAASDLIKALGIALPSLDLLLPKTAKIRAEFMFEGRDQLAVDFSASEDAGAGGTASGFYGMAAVSVKAGFSALYESRSTNKITLEVDFVSAHIPLD